MKKSYIGFYNPTKEELEKAWGSKNTIFIFDTNVLLNLYRYKDKTRNDFILSLDKIKDNIWIPFHVGLEYQYNRLNIIKNEKEIFTNITNKLNEIIKIKENLDNLKNRFPEIEDETDSFIKKLSKLLANYKNKITELDKKQPGVRTHDQIREKLNELFKNRIGKEPSQEYINEIEKEGEYRYEHSIPPGFEDKKKDEFIIYNNVKYNKKYGDLIIWKQILEKSKNKEINNVIFITDDIKSDWWYSINSNGNKIIGPNAYLISEIKNNKNITLFHMYETLDFLSDAKSFIHHHNISTESIDDIKKVNKDIHSPNYALFNNITFTDQIKQFFHYQILLNEYNDKKALLDQYIFEEPTEYTKKIEDDLKLIERAIGLNELKEKLNELIKYGDRNNMEDDEI